jgi:uncharacterized protein (TIGR02996 family)
MKEAFPVDGLMALVAAWQRTKHPRLAHLVDALDEQAAREAPCSPLVRSGKEAHLKAWRDTERTRDVRDLRALLAAAGGGSQDNVIAQVQALSQWNDPRLASGLLALLESPPYAGVKSRGMLKAILSALEETGDKRAAARARELAGRYLGIVNSGTGGWVVEQLLKIADRLDALPEPALGADLEAMCSALEARLGTRYLEQTTKKDLAGLFAAVYASPDDDAPRLVLADALLEQEDARGEHIVLQVRSARREATDEQVAREAELGSNDQLAAWAQPLSNAGDCGFKNGKCGFERGFPSRIALYTKVPRRVLGDIAWATITEITGLEQLAPKFALEILAQPTLRALRAVRRLNPELIAQLAVPWPYARMGITDAQALAPDAFRPAEKLRELELDRKGPLPEGLFVPLVSLEKLTMRDWRGANQRQGTRFATSALLPLTALRNLEIDLDVDQPPLELPAGLERLVLGAESVGQAAMSRLRNLRRLELSLSSLAGLGAALAALPSLEELSLASVRSEIPEDLFRGASRLKVLRLKYLSEIPAGLLRPLSCLTDLTLDCSGRVMSPGALRSLTQLVRLEAQELQVEEIPNAPLHTLTIVPPETRVAWRLKELLDRLPELRELNMTERLGYGRKLTPAEPVAIRLFQGSKLEVVRVNGVHGAVVLRRDGHGALSRMQFGPLDVDAAKRIAGLLDHVTEVTCLELPEKERRALEKSLLR